MFSSQTKKRRQIALGSRIRPWVCREAAVLEDRDPEAEKVPFLDIEELDRRGDYVKCDYCAWQHKKQCYRYACMRKERKDGKSIVMVRQLEL